MEDKRAGAQMKIDPIMQIMQKEDEQQPNGCIMQILAMCLTTTKNPQLERWNWSPKTFCQNYFQFREQE